MSHQGDHHSHSDEHLHGHSHARGHSHAPADFNRAFAVGVILNTALVVGQVVFGLIAHALVLLADAGHNFADVLGLVLAWWASRLGRSVPTRRRTYGLRPVSILASLANAVFLLVTMGAVGWDAIVRLQNPSPVQAKYVIALAALGIVVNGASALLFFSGRKGDLNIRVAFVHLAADAGVSLGVVAAGVAILFTGKFWIDPAMTLVIVAVILYGTWGLLKRALNLALQAVPENVDRDGVERFLKSLPGVKAFHDLHIWAMSTTQAALTVHLVMRPGEIGDSFLADVAKRLRDQFEIQHSTIQIEPESAPRCELAADERV